MEKISRRNGRGRENDRDIKERNSVSREREREREMVSNGEMVSPQYAWYKFGDTTETKVFVGGLAWECPTEELRRYFEQFGEILEAVIIAEKYTGRSKGYGFVTFRDPESARRSVADPNPLIDGRRANCNIAALGRSARTSPPLGMKTRRQRSVRQSNSNVTTQMPPVMYHAPYGYITYATEYGYQQGMYNPQMAMQYYQLMMYGSTESSTVSGTPHQYHHRSELGYSYHQSISQAQVHQQPYENIQIDVKETEKASFLLPNSQPRGFQLQAPPKGKKFVAVSEPLGAGQ